MTASATIWRANGKISRGASISRNGLKRLLGHVAEAEQARVAQVHDEMDAVLRARGNLDLQRDLVDVFGGRFDVDVELDVERRLDLPLEDLRARSDSRPRDP